MLPSRANAGGHTQEIVPAEVVSIDYKATNPEKMHIIRCRVLHAFGSISPDDTITARPVDYAMKRLPIVGEIVGLIVGPSPYGAAIKQTSEYYYLTTYGLQSSVHHNAIPGKHVIDNGGQSPTYKESESGHTKTSGESEVKLEDPNFVERSDIFQLQPYVGDILFEGRYGQSIRFGHTLKKDSQDFSVAPTWRQGVSQPGNPITVIRNGQGQQQIDQFTFGVENVDVDDSSLWLTSGQEVPFTLSSTVRPSLKNLKNDTYDKDANRFSGNQILAASGRILLNARQKEIIISAKTGVALTANRHVTVDAGGTIEMESSRINMGMNAIHPALLGDDTTNWLGNVMDQLIDLCGQLATEIHPTGFGPSGPPRNAPNYVNIKSKLVQLKKRLPELLSELVYLNKQSGGFTAQDEEYVEHRELDGQKDPVAYQSDVAKDRDVQQDISKQDALGLIS